MKRALLILGYGGHGRVVADVAQDGGYEDIAFEDDGGGGSGRLPPYPVRGAMTLPATSAARWPRAIAATGARIAAVTADIRKPCTHAGVPVRALVRRPEGRARA